MRFKLIAGLASTMLLLASSPALISAQEDPETEDATSGDGGAESGGDIDLGDITVDPDPFGFCSDGECHVSGPDLTKDDVLALDPNAVFTDDADPSGLVACYPGDGCNVLAETITAEDFEAGRPNLDKKAFVGAVDANLTGTWRVTDQASKMFCSRGGKQAPIPVKKNRHKDTVEFLDNGRLLLTGDGFSEVISRLGPGVYAVFFKASQRGMRIESRAFLGMQSDDDLRGFTESTLKRPNGTCTMTRGFTGVRLSGPDIEIERGDASTADSPGGETPQDGSDADGPDADDSTEQDPAVDDPVEK